MQAVHCLFLHHMLRQTLDQSACARLWQHGYRGSGRTLLKSRSMCALPCASTDELKRR